MFLLGSTGWHFHIITFHIKDEAIEVFLGGTVVAFVLSSTVRMVQPVTNQEQKI